MQHEEKKLKIVEKWFQQAAEDLRFAKYGLEAHPPFLKGAAFHAQQCAEKAMKGFLTFKGKAFKKTHDMRKLSEITCEIIPEIEPVLRPSIKLTSPV